MAAITCRFCQRELGGTKEEHSRNWYCKGCGHFDARECFKCRTREGFPIQTPWVTEADAARAVHDDPKTVVLKSFVYCERHFHEAYFVERTGQASTCRLCAISWDASGPAVHRWDVVGEGVGA